MNIARPVSQISDWPNHTSYTPKRIKQEYTLQGITYSPHRHLTQIYRAYADRAVQRWRVWGAFQGIEHGRHNTTGKPVTIPDIDDTTIRAIAVQAASTLESKDVTEMLAKADAIQEFIDPQAYGNEFTFTMEP